VGSGVWPKVSPRRRQRDYRLSPSLKRDIWLVTAGTRIRNEPGYVPMSGYFRAWIRAYVWLLPNTSQHFSPISNKQTNKQKTQWPLVRKRTIPTERPPLVHEI
jgi:hypothetical protein